MNGFMATLLKCTRTHWTSPQLTKRCFSKLDTKLKNIDQISTLHKSREDIASYVRFNRDFRVPSTDDFQELFSKSANSDKTEHELEEIRLKIGLICAEYEYFSFTNMRVPSALTCEDVRIMLNMNSNEARQMFFIKSYFRDTVRIRVKVKKIVKKSKKIEVNKEFMPGCFDGNGNFLLCYSSSNYFFYQVIFNMVCGKTVYLLELTWAGSIDKGHKMPSILFCGDNLSLLIGNFLNKPFRKRVDHILRPLQPIVNVTTS